MWESANGSTTVTEFLTTDCTEEPHQNPVRRVTVHHLRNLSCLRFPPHLRDVVPDEHIRRMRFPSAVR